MPRLAAGDLDTRLTLFADTPPDRVDDVGQVLDSPTRIGDLWAALEWAAGGETEAGDQVLSTASCTVRCYSPPFPVEANQWCLHGTQRLDIESVIDDGWELTIRCSVTERSRLDGS